jgi:predicted nucleic acid-binding protein
VSVITIGELRAGVLAESDLETRNRRLVTLSHALGLEPIPIDEPVADQWALLRVEMRDLGRRMPVNDSWIAATAITHCMPAVAQDQHCVDLPGLDVIRI